MHTVQSLFNHPETEKSHTLSGDVTPIHSMRDALPAFDFCVVDLETTGMSPQHGSEIIEIGAVRIEDGELSDTFQQLIEPQRSIPATITELTGITNQMVRGKPSVHEVMSDFVRFLDDAIILAHNFTFDFSFLDRYHDEDFYNDYICTVKLARNVADFPSNSLDFLNRHLSLNREDAHRALDDAVATGKLFKLLSQKVTDPEDYHRGGVPLCLHQINPGALVMNIPGVGGNKARAIDERFPRTEDLLQANRNDLQSVNGIGPKLTDAIHQLTKDFSPISPGRTDPVKLKKTERREYDQHHRDKERPLDDLIRQTE